MKYMIISRFIRLSRFPSFPSNCRFCFASKALDLLAPLSLENLRPSLRGDFDLLSFSRGDNEKIKQCEEWKMELRERNKRMKWLAVRGSPCNEAALMAEFLQIGLARGCRHLLGASRYGAERPWRDDTCSFV